VQNVDLLIEDHDNDLPTTCTSIQDNGNEASASKNNASTQTDRLKIDASTQTDRLTSKRSRGY
jgi:hypothetical protein